MKSEKLSIWGKPALVFLLITAAAVIYGQLSVSYAGWQPATCMPDHCFCETMGNGTIRQPLNTYSNLIYVFFGMLVWGMAPRQTDPKATNPIQRKRGYSLLYAFGLAAVGLGSFFYHASMTFIGQWFDLFGMYLLITVILLVNLTRVFPLGGRAFGISYLALNLLLGGLQIAVPQIRREVFGALLVAALLVEAYLLIFRRPRVKLIFFFTALGSMAAAYAFWILDSGAVLCDPRSLFQGHVVWHLLTGLAGWLMYLYYRDR
jgi:hypothetical protein